MGNVRVGVWAAVLFSLLLVACGCASQDKMRAEDRKSGPSRDVLFVVENQAPGTVLGDFRVGDLPAWTSAPYDRFAGGQRLWIDKRAVVNMSCRGEKQMPVSALVYRSSDGSWLGSVETVVSTDDPQPWVVTKYMSKDEMLPVEARAGAQ